MEFPSIRNEREFFEVAFSNRKTVKGYVRFYRRDGFQKFYDYEFANTYIVNFNETFDAVSKKPLTTKVQFNAGIVKRDDVEFATNWNPNNPFEKQAAPVSNTDDSEPQLLNYHIEDLEGNSIQKNKIKKNQEIYLVINSENAEGKVVEINLDNKSIDFEYNGKWMKDDIITNIILSSKTTRIKLKAIKQKQ